MTFFNQRAKYLIKALHTLVMCLEQLHQILSVVIDSTLQRCVTEFVSQRAVRPSPEEDVHALDVSSHAGNVQRSVGVVVELVHLASCVHELLHHSVVATIARLVQGVVLVDHRAVRTGSFAQEVFADLGAVVAHSPVERGHRESLTIFEKVVDTLVGVVQLALKERDSLVLLTVFDGPQ